MPDIGINVAAKMVMDTSQAQNAAKSFVNDLQNSTFQGPISPSQTPPLVNANENLFQTNEKIQGINEKLSKQKDSINGVIESLDQFKETVRKLNETTALQQIQNRQSNLPVAYQGGNLPNSVLAVERALPQQFFQVAGGNVLGAGMSAVNNGSNLLSGVLGSLGSGPLALGVGLGSLAVAAAQFGIQSEQKYEDAMPGIDRLLSAYGGNLTGNSAKLNANLGLLYRNGLLENNIDTGLSNNEFVNLASGLGRYGVRNIDNAGLMAQQAAQYARLTNGDSGDFLNYLGIASRYGSGNAGEELNYAYGAAMATGMSSNQFPEFLNSIEKVIEDSVAKGYTKSTKEVADTMVMFDKLSGGSEFWKGEQGVNRLMQINSGLASATGLNSTSDLIAYQALRGKGANVVEGGNWINDMIYMEQGLNPENYRAIANQINSTYGNDVESKVMAWKQISGLNYQGAAQLYNMSLNGASDEEITSTIEKLKTDPNMQSDTTRLANLMSSIETNMVNIGKNVFNVKVAGLDAIESMLGIIAGQFMDSAKNDMWREATGNLFNSFEVGDRVSFTNKFNSIYKNASTQQKVDLLQELSQYAQMSDDAKAAWNYGNFQSGLSEVNTVEELINFLAETREKAGTDSANYLTGEGTEKRILDAGGTEADAVQAAQAEKNSKARDVAKQNEWLRTNKGVENVQGGYIDFLEGQAEPNAYIKTAFTDSLTYLLENEGALPASIAKMVNDLGDNGEFDTTGYNYEKGLETTLKIISTELKKFNDDESAKKILEELQRGISVFDSVDSSSN